MPPEDTEMRFSALPYIQILYNFSYTYRKPFSVKNVNIISNEGLHMLTFQVGIYSKTAEDESWHTFFYIL